MTDVTEDDLKSLGLTMGEAKLFKREAAALVLMPPAAASSGGVAGSGVAAASSGMSKLTTSAAPTRNHLQPLLQTEYRGVIDIVSGYTPSHSCSHSMLHDLPAVLPEVVRMPFIVQECVRKLESMQHSAPAAAVKLPPDMALSILGYTYDLGLSSATDDGRCSPRSFFCMSALFFYFLRL